MTPSVLGGEALWPQWRGSHRDGKSSDTGLLRQWPTDGPKLLWTAKGLGGGYSTPSFANGRIYGMGYRGDHEEVWALDVRDGREVWSAQLGSAVRDYGYPDGPRCTPTVDGDRIYVLNPKGLLACLKSDSGEILWKQDLVDEFGGKMMSGWGFSESPLVDGDRLVCTPGGEKGTMLALNKMTGATLWQTTGITDKAAYSSIVIAEIQGVRQYVQLTGASVFGVDPETGAVLWRAARKGRTAVVTTPIVHDDLVYVTSAYGVGCSAFRIDRKGNKLNAERIYANKVMANHHGGVVLVDGHLYGYSDGKGWTCQDLETGEALWGDKALGKGAVTYADGHLYCRYEGNRGTVALVEATPEGYREKGRFDQPERSNKRSWPHPVITGGKLYLRDQDILLCFDVSR